jgi:tetratricopeptide (TPR) repeat protein
MNSAKLNVGQLTLYNPTRLTDEEIVAAFVARKAIFERVLEDIVAEKPRSRPQHHLVVGQRGMGKSTLLMRLAAELRTNAKLSNRFVPLVFAEEQYAVDRLSKFWLNCLDSLADAAERAGDIAASERIDAVVRSLKHQSGGTAEKNEIPARSALAAFEKAVESSGKRPVLLVDNLQLVFERIAEVEQHALRELLMSPASPVVVGASPSPPLETQDYGAAFYDHFKIHYLRALSADEMREVMLRLAEITDRTDVREKVLGHPERLKTLRDFTGGNPRTVVTLFFLYTEDFSPSVFADLENLLDRVTPLYKARIEELAEQQQVLVSAAADHWAPISARGLSEATGLPMSSISAQLDRLEKIGFVEKVEIFGQSSTGYQIAERCFNVWFLMRSASRRQRRAVEFLVRFIESFYEAEDRPRLARHLMNERDFSPDRFQFAKALASTLDPDDSEALARHAELDALRRKSAETRRGMEAVIDFSRLAPATLAFDDLREKLIALVPSGIDVMPEEFAERVLGDRQMFMRGERERLAATAGKLSEEKISAVLESIFDARLQDESIYGEASVVWFGEQLATGQLRSTEDRDDWNRLFMKAQEKNTLQMLIDTIEGRVGKNLKVDVRSIVRSTLTPESEADAWQWHNWAVCLTLKLGLYAEAEQAFRKAIELDPKDAHPWIGLGDLLQDHLGRFEESESAYRKAIELDPRSAYPWAGLGKLFQYHLGRFEESESGYRKAIELDPRSAYPWAGLGDLLKYNLDRFEESESAYLKAIDVDPRSLSTWGSLGNLYCDFLRRYSDAASAYANALALDGSNECTLQNLVFLHRDFMGDALSAREAFESIQRKLLTDSKDTFKLHEALFAAYDANWGLCKRALAEAMEVIGRQFPFNTAEDWFRASAVLVHLNYAEDLMAFLRKRGDDARLRPWFEALSALHQGDRRFLQNIPVEVRTTAEYYFDQIEKRLNALPEKTRRRPAPKPPKKRRKS